MLKRILIIALLTGAGQLFIIFSLKFISHNATPDVIESIARIDSMVWLLISIIAFGLQPAAMRDLAINANWRPYFDAAQSARFTLGTVLLLLSLLAFTDRFYLVILISPVLALNGDYALYGRGHPVMGAFIAFLRAVVPFSALVVFVFINPDELAWIYAVAIGISWLLTSIGISVFMKTSLVPAFSFSKLKLFLDTLPLGIVSFGLYFLGIGVILIIPYFYPTPVVATVYVGLKFYVIFKGVLRIIQQAFLKEMVKDEIVLKVDQIGSILGLTYAGFLILFPESFISFFFGAPYLAEKKYFIVLALAAVIYSMFSGFTTKAMLEKKDRRYAIITLLAALITASSAVILSYFSASSFSVGISLLAGEVFFAAGMLALLKQKNLLKSRLLFLTGNLIFLLPPIIALVIWGDDFTILLPAFSLFALLIFFRHKGRFNLPEAND